MLPEIRLPILILLLSFAAAQPQKPKQEPPPPGMPAPQGVYFQQGPEQWVQLAHIPPRGSRIKGMDNYLMTAGLTNLNMSFDYDGPRATLQLSARRPTFFVRGVGAAQDALIVRLTQKKDRRTVGTLSSLSGVKNKGGFKAGAIREVVTAPFSGGAFSVTPLVDLKPGEYLLVFGYPQAAFDFGVRRAKK